MDKVQITKATEVDTHMIELPEPTPELFMAISDEQFRSFVDDDTRSRLNEIPIDDLGPTERARFKAIAATLRHEKVVLRWHDTLEAMHQSVEGQLAAKAADAAALAAEGAFNEAERSRAERWRAGAIRFKVGLEPRLAEAKRLVRQYHLMSDKTEDERNAALLRVATLEAAIRKHRDGFDSNDEATDLDRELWSYVGR